ncbi:Taurocyamine kinase [Clonorchis sinensis]|uniref:Taurocyamine kinase n=4 Tax=Digenea TaxID=6179 RepID=G7YHA8_CLOSI|nr:taurocyamine kinase [Clonorchis sinensis]KAG5453933.1 Taurocyamine kinase [Clonorchis sinensis]GAA52341.1 taurocyamine kinase [Clonorchis sinensis]
MQVEPLKSLQQKIVNDEANRSFTKKHLTNRIVDLYADKKTSFGGSLAQCVSHNARNPRCILPRACDLDAYEAFREFFDAVIIDYHKVKGDKITHPKSDFGDLKSLNFKDLNADGNMVVSTRVRLGRTVAGYGFCPTISNEQRLELEKKISTALKDLSGEFKGTYYPLTGMKEEDRKKLVEKHFLFRDDDSVLRDAGGYIDWPNGRGIFINEKENFLVWVNEEDHIRVISMQKGGDLIAVYKRLANAISELGKSLTFATNDRFGFITFCPSNLGTTLRASVHARVPYLSALPNFEQICEKYNIQARGTHGEHTASVGGVYDLSNKRRLGLTEIEAVTEMYNGVQALLDLEKQLAAYNKDAPAGVMPVEPLTYLSHLLEAADPVKNYTRKHLTPEIIKKYDGVRTTHGATLAHMVRNGAYNPHSICPRTGEAECYTKFVDYLDAVILDYHGVSDPAFKHPPPTFGDLNNLPFGDVDPEGKFVVSTRVRVGRSVDGFLFSTIMSKQDRLDLETKVSTALKSLTGDHAGSYYPLANMSEATRKQLVEDHFLFKNDDPVLRDAGGYRDWPHGRGIFHNANKTFLVWLCEEDHMRIISMQKGGDLAAVYKRLIQGIQAIEKTLPFAHSDKYGYITCCPSNLGTTMRASVLLKIPKLSAQKAKLDEVCAKYRLQARGLHGEHTESPEGIHDISNKRRLGLTELEAAKEMADGVAQMIAIEKSLP